MGQVLLHPLRDASFLLQSYGDHESKLHCLLEPSDSEASPSGSSHKNWATMCISSWQGDTSNSGGGGRLEGDGERNIHQLLPLGRINTSL